MASPSIWFCALALAWAGARFIAKAETSGVTALGIAVCLLAVWEVATNLWTNPSYTVAAPYHAAFLAAGFYVGRRAGATRHAMLLSVALAFAVGVSVWGVWQWSSESEARAHSLFITPATLGAFVNLVFLPTLVLFVCGARSKLLLPILVVLAITLGLSQSRGAWVALGGALVILLLLQLRARLPIDRRRLTLAAVVLACVAVMARLAAVRAEVFGVASGAAIEAFSTVSMTHRFQLYELVLNNLAASPWLFGTGYHSFFYLLDSSRLSLPAYTASQTYFVHNDYLQFLLELGVPGAAGLLVLVAAPLVLGWRALGASGLANEDRIALIAAVAATTSMAVHALVDFPFYIPACLLVYGGVLGVLDAILLRAAGRGFPLPGALANITLRRAAGAALATLIVWMLVVPVMAEIASEYGLRQWPAGRGQQAAFGFEAARRLDPRDWRYHWYAGQFWMAEAQNRKDRAAAAYAERALVAAEAANSREVRPLYDRIRLHRHLGTLLAAPATPETLLAWANRAVELAPADPAVRAERDSLMKELPPVNGGQRK